jgi:hypothetical protein
MRAAKGKTPSEMRALIELWWEESHDVDELRRRLNEKLARIEERMYHGDEAALLYWALHETRATDVLHPLERVKISQFVDAMLMCDELWYEAKFSSDREIFVGEFIRLPHRLRKEYFKRVPPVVQEWILDVVGEEVYGLLDKAWVEVVVALSVKDAISLARRYGKEWRTKVKELLVGGLGSASEMNADE